jgi:ABC-2 type transport system ATP-binding protein
VSDVPRGAPVPGRVAGGTSEEIPAVELAQLTRDYGTTRALDGVSLRVPRGRIFGYVGSNGAGKTTTLKILTGLLRPTAGDARVSGISVLEQPLEVKARLGYVPESGALFEKLDPLEYLTWIGRLYRIDEAELGDRIAGWLDFFGLTARRGQPIGALSKGLKQKVCWISALVHEPEVLVLDEPLNGLDVESVARVKELLIELAGKGRTVFYCSHLIDVVERVCDGLAVIRAGRLQFAGTPAELLSRSGAPSLERALLDLGAAEPT